MKRSIKNGILRWISLPTLLLAAVALTDGSHVGALTLFAAFLHECGHLIAARLLRVPTRGLRPDALGVRLDVGGAFLSYGEEWLLCAAGPMTSLLCAAAAAPLWQYANACQVFSVASLVLGLLNLLPISDFDGGRMLRSFCAYAFGPAVARRTLSLTSALFWFLLWAFAVYFLLLAGDGLSLFCFSVGLLWKFFDSRADQMRRAE